MICIRGLFIRASDGGWWSLTANLVELGALASHRCHPFWKCWTLLRLLELSCIDAPSPNWLCPLLMFQRNPQVCCSEWRIHSLSTSLEHFWILPLTSAYQPQLVWWIESEVRWAWNPLNLLQLSFDLSESLSRGWSYDLRSPLFGGRRDGIGWRTRTGSFL